MKTWWESELLIAKSWKNMSKAPAKQRKNNSLPRFFHNAAYVSLDYAMNWGGALCGNAER